MLRFICLMVLLSLLSVHAFACDGEDIRKQLNQAELAVLMKNAPTFQHAWQDGTFKLSWSELKPHAQACQAQLQVTLPEADLAEANQYLQANPAKRILMAAQGYAVAEQAVQQLDFFYQVEQGKVKTLNQDHFALRQLHSNIEYTYQLLAQLRIAVSANSQNTQAWPDSLQQSELTSCQTAAKLTAAGCACRLQALQQHVSPRQKELLDYIRQQPYSVAAGVMDGFVQLSKQIDQGCSTPR